jgi:hypothetical protein
VTPGGDAVLQSDRVEEADYRVSSYTGGGNCVAVARLASGSVAVKHSWRRDVQPIVFTRDEWIAFIAGVKDGEFDA